jgi:hypothetical protein
MFRNDSVEIKWNLEPQVVDTASHVNLKFVLKTV